MSDGRDRFRKIACRLSWALRKSIFFLSANEFNRNKQEQNCIKYNNSEKALNPFGKYLAISPIE